jgi:uncharacterized iron-regulated protein
MTDSHYPALVEWQRQLAAGERSRTDFDQLWQAASYEQWAADFAAWGLPAIAASFRRDALHIIEREAEAQRRSESDRRSA